MCSLIRDTFYRLGSDRDGFSLEQKLPHNPGREWQVWWEVISYRDLVTYWESLILAETAQAPYWISFLGFITGERPQRRAISRKLAHGSRNISLAVMPLRKYVTDATKLILTREEWDLIHEVSYKLERNIFVPPAKVNKAQKLYDRHLTLLNKTESFMSREMSHLFQSYGLPDASEKNMQSFEISPNIINLTANEACREYLRRVRGTEREPIFFENLEKIETHLKEHFTDDAEALIDKLKRTISDTLAALSLSTEQGKLLVSIVNPYGKYVRMEAWKFLKLVKEHDTTQRWGGLNRKGYDEPEPLVQFGDMKTGEIFAKLRSERYCIEVVCCPNSNGSDSPKAKSTVSEQAWFYVEPNYLVCLAVAIEKLLEDQKHFSELMQRFETEVTHDPFEREIW